MRVLFDQGTPVPLRHLLRPHSVETAYELGWATSSNGDLLRQAETHGFEVLVTTDTNLKYQQNLSTRRIAIVVLTSTSWPRIRVATDAIGTAVAASSPGSYREVEIP